MMGCRWIAKFILCVVCVGCARGTAVSPSPTATIATFSATEPIPTATIEPSLTPLPTLRPTEQSTERLPTVEMIQPTDTATPQPTPTVPTPTPAPVVWRLNSAAGIPPLFVQTVTTTVATTITDDDGHGNSDLTVQVQADNQLGAWHYAVVAPFFTVQDDVSLDALQGMWTSGKLLVTAETAALLSAWWKLPAPDGVIIPPDQLQSAIWDNPQWAIIPFDQLQPDLKVISVDGHSLLDAKVGAYPLTIPIGVNGNDEAITELLADWQPINNRDVDKMTRVAMTGVTALVRATAAEMEINGILWPGEEVSDVMNAADIAHLSNEIPFADDCPPPDRESDLLIFCSPPSYFALIESLGIDVVELTGNHSNDYGTDAFLMSLDMYANAGMERFGGGRDLEDSRSAAQFRHNGNTIAFVGCNPVGPGYSWATDEQPGTRPCDGTMQSQISELAAQGIIVISTFQYHEIYSYGPTIQEQFDFRLMADAGASIVSGSQGHHAAAFDLYNGSVLHYGLGNFFFDQMFSMGTRQTFIDQHIIYDGRLISTELDTYLIERYARPRAMTNDERQDVLKSVFEQSFRP